MCISLATVQGVLKGSCRNADGSFAFEMISDRVRKNKRLLIAAFNIPSSFISLTDYVPAVS